MNIAILGTGMVGQTLAASLAALGHDVAIGTRDVEALMARTEPGPYGNPPYSAWAQEHPAVKTLALADAAAHGDILFNALSGANTLDGLRAAGAQNLAGKILIDVANPLDFSGGFPPSLSVVNTDSLGEQIQREFPETKVVKALNTVNAMLMVNPGQLADGEHSLFVCGNDADARSEVTRLLGEWFGWKDIIDLGDITNARGTEQLLPLWVRLYGALQTPMFNFRIVR
ncbi:MAG TPA: NAD(P)-binding domain-containing protein [Longimicrobiales bacterium]|nr:NAD(P)-binding domain-containing protein [Longimicrobiales bacterium]